MGYGGQEQTTREVYGATDSGARTSLHRKSALNLLPSTILLHCVCSARHALTVCCSVRAGWRGTRR
jgi:hypothetical protein